MVFEQLQSFPPLQVVYYSSTGRALEDTTISIGSAL